jgi:hypothetical protein
MIDDTTESQDRLIVVTSTYLSATFMLENPGIISSHPISLLIEDDAFWDVESGMTIAESWGTASNPSGTWAIVKCFTRSGANCPSADWNGRRKMKMKVAAVRVLTSPQASQRGQPLIVPGYHFWSLTAGANVQMEYSKRYGH